LELEFETKNMLKRKTNSVELFFNFYLILREPF